MQEDPDAIVAVGVDGNAEAQITRKRKRNEAFQHQQEMERVRAEEESRVVSWDEVDGKGVVEEGEEIEGDDENDNENNDEDDDDEDDNEYLPPTHGHQRKRSKKISLDFDVDTLRKTHSVISDRRKNSSIGRADTLSNFVMEGGGNLYDVPCSQRTMIK